MAVTIDGTNGITNVNGSATTPAETGTDTDTGIYYGTNTVSLATGGTQRFTIDSSGNVGIGTASPAYKLDVTGQGRATTGFAVSTDGSTFTPSGLNAIPNYGTGYITSTSRVALSGFGGLSFYTNQALSMLVDQSGNVGIGTSTPGYKLDVTGSSVVARINSSNNNNVLAISYNGTIGGYFGANGTNLIFGNNAGSEAMRIDSSGNVLVGTSSQLYSSKLTVEAGTANATTYTTVAAKGGSSMAHQQQSTTGVSTSLVTILTPGTGPYAAFCVVFGSDGTNRFIDLVLFSVGTGTINVVSSLSAAGTPAARTYAQNSSSLQLSMGSGTYTVQVTTIGMGS